MSQVPFPTRIRVAAWNRLLRRPVTRLFHQGLVIQTSNFERTEWLGVPIRQNILDLWTIQETLAEIRPALLIEVGTWDGGSALFYAHLMDLMDHGRVVTVDIVDKRKREHPRVEFLLGDSVSSEIAAELQRRVADADGPVMVILDGNHDQHHVAKELELYAPLVTPGSYLLSQDGAIDERWMFADSRPGPLGANSDFLARHPEFEHDQARNDRFLLSHHPLGWMRRKSA